MENTEWTMDADTWNSNRKFTLVDLWKHGNHLRTKCRSLRIGRKHYAPALNNYKTYYVQQNNAKISDNSLIKLRNSLKTDYIQCLRLVPVVNVHSVYYRLFLYIAVKL